MRHHRTTNRFLLVVALWIHLCSLDLSSAFSLVSPLSTKSVVFSTRNRSTRVHCICINCKWVTSCQAYHFVESKHEQPHMTPNPTFEPRDGSPTIHVNIRTIRNESDRKAEVDRMWREHAAETTKAEAVAIRGETLVGETVYDFSPVTTYEYDVVQCEDFIEDKGCWIRNMPEEIRLANPNFVPS